MFGFRDFKEIKAITKKIEKSSFFESQLGETLKEDNGFIIFDTQKQKTWIIVSNKNIYCILDDVKSEKIFLKFKLPQLGLSENLIDVTNANLATDLNLSAPKQFLFNVDDKYKGYGRVLFPNTLEWLYYSLRIFPNNKDFISTLNRYVKRANEIN